MKTPISMFAAFLACASVSPARTGKDLGAIWFIGDSITQSNADGDKDGSPRKALHDLLVKDGYQFSFTGHFAANPDGLPATGKTPADNLYHFHSGISGAVIGADNGSRKGLTQNIPAFWKTGRLASAKPKVIIIMLGANDINSDIETATAPERLGALVDTIYAQPDVGNPTVLISNITPNRVPKTNATGRVAAYNAAVPQVVAKLRARGRNVHFVDVFGPVDREYDKTMDLDPDPAKTRFDHLHPGRYGNEVMAKQWFEKLRGIPAAP